MYLLIVLLPILASGVAGFAGRALGKYGAELITISCLGLTTIFSYIAFYQIGFAHHVVYLELFPWIDSGMLHTSWGFIFDSVTVTMLITVTTISLLVHIYSTGYMSHDPHIPRFMSYLSLFTFFMLVLVTGDNFIQMFVGWEGVGLCSYLLISFWHTRIEANKAAMKAMIVNRIGDFGLAIGIAAIFFLFKSINFTTVFALAPSFVGKTFVFLGLEFDCLSLICCFLFLGAMGKSAQIGLHTWLPDAMEGPTPVSALIHAATMVTAGVFLLIRCSPLLEFAPTSLFVITVIGASTAFFAATTGLVQNDLKKVIAYSTCSQLGYMIFACGLSSYSASLFHLMNHAFFKALLFLGAGCVIHAFASNQEQDMRKMGGIAQLLPLTFVMMTIGSLSLMGFPFLTGFYSKDMILELAYSKFTLDSTFAYWLGITSALFTAFYSFRLLILTYLTPTNAPRSSILLVHEAPFSMAFPLLVLAFGSIFVGYIAKDMMVGLGTDFWQNAIVTQKVLLLEAEFIPTWIKLIPVLFSLAGAALALFFYTFAMSFFYSLQLTWLGGKVYTFLIKKWYFDNIYNEFFAKQAMSFGYQVSFKVIDRGIIEIFGPYGFSTALAKFTRSLSNFQTGFVYNYAFVMLVGLIIIVTILGSDISTWNLSILFLLAAILKGV